MASTALILGKFLPPHKGHRFLAESARQLADEVIVCLLANSREPIPVDLRHRWLEHVLPWATVVSTIADHPVDYEDDAIHDLWAETIRGTIGGRNIDWLVTSEPAYGDAIADRLGARHRLLDAERSAVPISAAEIRADPLAHLEFVDEPVSRWLEGLEVAARAALRDHVPLGPQQSGHPARCGGPRQRGHGGAGSNEASRQGRSG
jgi:HTH-type transcriptional repressor of NAD biosynthesis genes